MFYCLREFVKFVPRESQPNVPRLVGVWLKYWLNGAVQAILMLKDSHFWLQNSIFYLCLAEIAQIWAYYWIFGHIIRKTVDKTLILVVWVTNGSHNEAHTQISKKYKRIAHFVILQLRPIRGQSGVKLPLFID